MRAGVVLLGAALAFPPQGDGIVRLKPREFRQLPAAVRRDLDRRRCTIPQSLLKVAPHNVIAGSFISRRSRDWAVLCSVKGSSRILVYRGGGASRVDSLGRIPDSAFMQDIGSGVIRFGRVLEIASSKSIAERATALGVPKPPGLDHDGIGDGLTGKDSTVFYYSRGKWRELPGAN